MKRITVVDMRHEPPVVFLDDGTSMPLHREAAWQAARILFKSDDTYPYIMSGEEIRAERQ
jgi:hypothetical protein